MAKPIDMPESKVDSVDRGSPAYFGVAGGFSNDGRHYILMAESAAALRDLLKHTFPEWEPAVEKFVDAVLVSREHTYLEGDEL